MLIMDVNYLNWKVYEREPEIFIDAKDKNLLKLLVSDSRISLNKIAKKMKISKVAVFNRIRKLEDKKVITGYSCLINFSALGFSYYNIGFSLDMSFEEKKEFINELDKLDFIHQITQLSGGEWEFLIRIISKDEFLQENLTQILELGNLKNFSVLDIDTLGYIDEHSKKLKTFTRDNISLSKFEITLLYELAKNSRQKIIKLASKLKTNVPKIMNTIKSFIQRNIIFTFSIHLDPFIFGGQGYFLMITTKKRKNQNKIFENLISLYSTGGILHFQNPNIMTIHIVDSFKQLVEVENVLRKHIDGIESYRFVRVVSQIKYHFFPKSLFDELNQNASK